MVAVLLSTFIGGVYAAQNVPAIQQVFVTNFPKNQNVTVTNLPQSKFLSVFINKTMGIGEIASYPVAGWKTVSIMTNVTTITNIGITIQLPIPFWGFTLSGVRGCLLAGSGNCNISVSSDRPVSANVGINSQPDTSLSFSLSLSSIDCSEPAIHDEANETPLMEHHHQNNLIVIATRLHHLQTLLSSFSLRYIFINL